MWLWSPSSRSFSVRGFDGALNVDITEFLDGHGLENSGISSEKMAISMGIQWWLWILYMVYFIEILMKMDDFYFRTPPKGDFHRDSVVISWATPEKSDDHGFYTVKWMCWWCFDGLYQYMFI